MSTISMNSASELSSAIRHLSLGKDVYLTIRDGDGTVLYSASVDQWSTNSDETTVKLQPIDERINRAVEMHALVKRAEMTQQARDKGIL